MNDLLKIVADYADQLATAEELADSDTMTVAAALDELYEARGWVAEWLEQSPRKDGRSGSNFREDSRNRFHHWLVWKLQQEQRRSPKIMTTYRLLDAADVADALKLTNGEIQHEAKVRPMKWLLKNGYRDRAVEVWKIAVDLAGTADGVQQKHVTEALGLWKKQALGPRGVANAIKTSRAKRQRIKALAEVRALVALAKETSEARDELRHLLNDIETMIVNATPAKPHLKVVGD
jgi:hypothetical protein